jgi:hypothetical protein
MIRVAAPALAAMTLTGCGLFKSSGLSGRYEPEDPNRVADRVVAGVSNTTPFTADAASDKAAFRATLYDSDGRQFFGPAVTLDGDAVTTDTPGSNTSTAYVKADLDYAAGKTYTVSLQGHTATTPPAPAPLRITAPVPSKNDKGATLNYFDAQPGDAVTVSWTGGDPAQPVYIVLNGSPDSNGMRRFFVSDNPAMSPTDPLNYGLPIANTGSYTIPAQITERVQAADGSTSTRTTTTFDSPIKKGGATNAISIYVIQRGVTQSGPINFSVATLATAAAGITAYK